MKDYGDSPEQYQPKPYYVQKKTYPPFKYGGGGKTAAISEAMKRKEAGIKRFSDLKSVSIGVSSAFNSASDLCNILVDKGVIKMVDEKGKRTAKDYWDTHDALYSQFLEAFTDAQDEAKIRYESAISGVVEKAARKQEIAKDAADSAAMDFANS